jgi:hypothetical protein
MLHPLSISDRADTSTLCKKTEKKTEALIMWIYKIDETKETKVEGEKERRKGEKRRKKF